MRVEHEPSLSDAWIRGMGMTHLTRPMRLTLPDGSRSNSVKLTAGTSREMVSQDTCMAKPTYTLSHPLSRVHPCD